MVIDNKGMEIDHRHQEVVTTSRTVEETSTASTMVAVTDSVEAIWIAADILNLAEEVLEEEEEEEEAEVVASRGTTKVEMEDDTKITGMVVDLPSSIQVQRNHFNLCVIQRRPRFKKFHSIQTSIK